MRMTQADHDARVARLAAGQGTDDDARLVKLYESRERDEAPAENASVSHAVDRHVELEDGGQGADDPAGNGGMALRRKRGAAR